MNEKMNAANNGAGCGRGEELVAYLYGEADNAASETFRKHLSACNACREELAALGGVREAVGEWRARVLGALPSLNIEASFAPAADARTTPARRRSALAALREFFSLSPLWLQFGAVAAALAVCALAALTFARTEVRWDSNGLAFRTDVKDRVVEKERVVQVPVQTGYTDEQVSAMVNERVGRELAVAQAKWEADNSRRVSYLEAALRQQRSANRGGVTSASRQSRRPSASGGGSQLADAGDPFSAREERVPRLTDLLGAVNTPR